MDADPSAKALPPLNGRNQVSTHSHLVVPRVNLVRRGCIEPFLDVRPTLSSSDAQWRDIALESYETPAVSIHDHEHPEHFLHMVVSGTSTYEVKTRGRSLRFTASPGTMILFLGVRSMRYIGGGKSPIW